MKAAAALVIGFLTASGFAVTTNAHLAETEKFKIDSIHSAVIFRCKHMNAGYTYGRFNDVDGKFSFGDADSAANSLDVTIKAESIDTNSKQRDEHMRGPDFFNCKQFPTLSFKSKEFKKAGGNKYKVTGDLTVHGVTKTITVDLEHTGTAESQRAGKRCGFETMFEIKRADYNMNYMPDALGADIRIIVALEGVKE